MSTDASGLVSTLQVAGGEYFLGTLWAFSIWAHVMHHGTKLSSNWHSHHISIQEHIWDVVEIRILDTADKSAAAVGCDHVNMDQSLRNVKTNCMI